jgi:hypothetical protein
MEEEQADESPGDYCIVVLSYQLWDGEKGSSLTDYQAYSYNSVYPRCRLVRLTRRFEAVSAWRAVVRQASGTDSDQYIVHLLKEGKTIHSLFAPQATPISFALKHCNIDPSQYNPFAQLIERFDC